MITPTAKLGVLDIKPPEMIMTDTNDAGAKLRARFVGGEANLDLVYPPAIRTELARRVQLVGAACSAKEVLADPALLAETQLMFTTWGAPRLDEALLDAAPNLTTVFYGAGTIKSVMTREAWRRGIVITSAASANAVPVAEFTFAQIILAMKRVWHYAAALKQNRQWKKGDPGATAFGSTVGLVSLGEIGRRVAKMLSHTDMQIVAHDVQPDHDFAASHRVRYVDLEELFATSDVVSLHTPLLPQTQGMFDEPLLRSMKPGATLINTARGKLVDEPAMIRVLKDRPDLLAILDVVATEPLPGDSPLYDLPNAILTPHIAGSLGAECGRMGQYMLEELDRYLAGQPLQYHVTEQAAANMA